MKQTFNGLAMYYGPDDKETGLKKGSVYLVRTCVLDNGKVRVSFDLAQSCSVKVRKLTCSDKGQYRRLFKETGYKRR